MYTVDELNFFPCCFPSLRNIRPYTRNRHCNCGRSGDPGGSTRGPRSVEQEECSCLPEAPLPDTSPLPVDGVGGNGGDSRGGEADGTVLGPSSSYPSSPLSPLEAQGRQRTLAGHDRGGRLTGSSSDHGAVGFAPGGGLSGGGGGGDYDVGESDAPKSVESLRERLRQKDALR